MFPQATVYEEISYQALTIIFERKLDSDIILSLLKEHLIQIKKTVIFFQSYDTALLKM